PCHLTFRIRTRAAPGFVDRIGERHFVRDDGGRFLVSDRAERARVARKMREQLARLIDETVLVHRFDAAIERLDEPRAIESQCDSDGRKFLRGVAAHPIPARDRTPAGDPDFQRAFDAMAIRRGDLSTTLRIDFRQPAMQPLRAAWLVRDRANALADRFIASWHL